MTGFTDWICKGRRLEAVLFLVTVFFLVVMAMCPRKVASAEPVRSWEIWHDGEMKLYKVQDGSCTLYLARGYVNGFGGGASSSMVAGPGCRP